MAHYYNMFNFKMFNRILYNRMNIDIRKNNL